MKTREIILSIKVVLLIIISLIFRILWVFIAVPLGIVIIIFALIKNFLNNYEKKSRNWSK